MVSGSDMRSWSLGEIGGAPTWGYWELEDRENKRRHSIEELKKTGLKNSKMSEAYFKRAFGRGIMASFFKMRKLYYKTDNKAFLFGISKPPSTMSRPSSPDPYYQIERGSDGNILMSPNTSEINLPPTRSLERNTATPSALDDYVSYSQIERGSDGNILMSPNTSEINLPPTRSLERNTSTSSASDDSVSIERGSNGNILLSSDSDSLDGSPVPITASVVDQSMAPDILSYPSSDLALLLSPNTSEINLPSARMELSELSDQDTPFSGEDTSASSGGSEYTNSGSEYQDSGGFVKAAQPARHNGG
ncbi:hypothetical protein B9479_006163 [Cryptococcus floricola]|uniref:Uncharacterized protein n=1 Tax=Cryptococcus floricola TaxID=2591691 RepID=A0A5D3AP25_9TREE|nr:hypothetical protein B9479_006163 [Cryptococcus floricola]